MINGFEEHTAPLTDYEKRMAQVIAKGFEDKVGKEKAISSSQIIMKMKAVGWDINGPRLRKIINYLRIKKLVRNLISNSKGYYRSNSERETRNYVESLRQRSRAINAVADSFDFKPKYPIQQRLPYKDY